MRALFQGLYDRLRNLGKYVCRTLVRWAKWTSRLAGIWGILLVLLAASAVCAVKGADYFHKDKVLSSTINAPLTEHKLEPSPYLRIYVNPNDESRIQELTVTSELGKSADPGKGSFDWIHVLFSGAPSLAPFSWKIALLCVPADTVVRPGPELSEIVEPTFTVDGPCPSKQAISEVIVTGKYSTEAIQSAPVTDISRDTSGVVSFGFPLTATDPFISASGSDYIANFPSVESQDACLPAKEPTPSIPILSNDGGPIPAPQESRMPDCDGIKMLTIRKVLDVAAANTTQVPAAAGPETDLARPGLAWLDIQPNNILSVQVNSPSQDAMAHLDEVYGAVYWGVAAAAFIALLTETREQKGHISELYRKIRKRRSPTTSA